LIGDSLKSTEMAGRLCKAVSYKRTCKKIDRKDKALFVSAFQLKSKKQKQIAKSKTDFWNAEKKAYEEMN
jgi:hypothetical protein